MKLHNPSTNKTSIFMPFISTKASNDIKLRLGKILYFLYTFNRCAVIAVLNKIEGNSFFYSAHFLRRWNQGKNDLKHISLATKNSFCIWKSYFILNLFNNIKIFWSVTSNIICKNKEYIQHHFLSSCQCHGKIIALMKSSAWFLIRLNFLLIV